MVIDKIYTSPASVQDTDARYYNITQMEEGVYSVYTPSCAPRALARGVQPLGVYTLYTPTFHLCYGFIPLPLHVTIAT